MHIADLPPDAALIERLVTLMDGPSDERLVCFRARCEHAIKSVDIDRPTLALVLRGQKHVQCGNQADQFEPGDLLAVAPGVRLDVVNRPDPADGRYFSLSIPLCDEVLGAARLLWTTPLVSARMDFVRIPAGSLCSELTALADAAEADDELRARMAVLALLTQLVPRGCGDLLLPPAPRLSAQVRELVAQAPDRPWQSRDFEQALGCSGATLRRRLADEGLSLRELIAQARLALALLLLQTTRWPVKSVAAKVGYRSAESFSRRFRERYGLDASAMGNALPEAA